MADMRADNAIEVEAQNEKKTLEQTVSNAPSDLKTGEVVDLDQVSVGA